MNAAPTPFRTRFLAALLTLSIGCTPAFATCGGGGGGGRGGVVPKSKPEDTFRVSWESLPLGKTPPPTKAGKSLLILWFPVSLDIAGASSLQRSAELTALNARCVFTGLVTPGNEAVRKTYAISATHDTVVITTRDGTEIARVTAERGKPLVAEQAESLVRTALETRKAVLEDLFAAAAKKQTSGDIKGATADFKSVWAERCLFAPLGQRAAEKLKALGTPVTSAGHADHTDAPLTSAQLQQVRLSLEAGLKAEIEARYTQAEEHYVHALVIAPNDPTALRFLGEFYRHQTGRWDRAGRLFNRILDQPSSDPIARAVALHGLGKMTIHSGRFAEGLALFEKSLEAYPLPITYRNLAVYWFSEKQSDKAAAYMRQALALDSDDTYNQIFAAVYLAAAGQHEEALKVARANDHVLEASYNLAAIWAQAGDRAKAMELLRRQFYTYEQYDAVRAMEMKEAREDWMFASLHTDPAFDALTKGAKNAWMVGREFCSPDQLIPLTAAPGPRMN